MRNEIRMSQFFARYRFSIKWLTTDIITTRFLRRIKSVFTHLIYWHRLSKNKRETSKSCNVAVDYQWNSNARILQSLLEDQNVRRFMYLVDIIEKVMKPPPLIRPSVSKGAAPPEAINIMRQCWAETSEMRPDFDDVHDLFKKLNHGR